MTKTNIFAPRAFTRFSTGRRRHVVLAGLASLALAANLAACSGGGGDNGHGNPGRATGAPSGGGVINPSQPGGLTFSYPIDGQDDVYTQTQIAFAFGGQVKTGSASSLTLVANPGTGNAQAIDTDVTQAADQSGIFRLAVHSDDGGVERPALQPNTKYAVQATDTIGTGNTRFNAGDTLFTFTTRPLDGRPSGNGAFTVAHETRIGTQRVPFTQFNPIRARFSEPVDEGSVKLCTASESLGDNNCSVTVTGPNGNVPGRLTALGRYFTFDPTDDLTAGASYTVAFASDVKSAFGTALSGGGFSVTPVSIGNDVEQNLLITSNSGNNSLNGLQANQAQINSQLIGENDQDASAAPERGGLITRLAEPSTKASFDNTFPALIPAGQVFNLSPINLKLNGTVQTPVQTGVIHSTFVNDASVYIAANSLRNIEAPTRVLIRFDLGISTDVGSNDPVKSLSNGVFNQTAMNVVATGIAVPQDNGDLKLTTLGSFPASVNRTGNAITDFELELTLPAGSQQQVQADQTPPTIIAQYPSACFYTFNTAAFDGNEDSGATSLSAPEADCIAVLDNRQLQTANQYDDPDDSIDITGFFNVQEPPGPTGPIKFRQTRVSSLPLNASPSIVFSEPVDPTSLAGNITLTNVASSTAVPVRLRSEGSSVVIDPVDPLTPATQYTIDVSNGVTDLAGNGLTGNFPGSTIVSDITFNTEPLVIPDTDDGSTFTGAVRQTSPFLTVLSPGLPCALKSNDDNPASDFRSGGDIAGNCEGDTPRTGTIPPVFGDPIPVPDSPELNYQVFKQPANVPVSAHFSKRVQTDSIIYANGCLIGGSGNAATAGDVAVQVMDSDGNCTGVVAGDIAALTPNQPLTRGFSFQPTNAFEPGQRYWIVICGNANDGSSSDRQPATGPSSCSTTDRIVDRGGRALNTTPLVASGTRSSQATETGTAPSGDRGNRCSDTDVVAPSFNSATSPLGGILNCFVEDSSGGPDLVMPFDAVPDTQDFYATTLALPQTDTNGNGFFDNEPPLYDENNVADFIIGGTNTGEDRGRQVYFNDAQGREIAQPANSVFAFANPFGPAIDAGADGAFLSGGQEVAIRELATGQDCSGATQVMLQNGTPDDPSDDTPVVGTSVPESCVPVSLLPGSFKVISSIPSGGAGLAQGGLIQSGRVLLRFPNARDNNGDDSGNAQTGYIVPNCQGTLKTPTDPNDPTGAMIEQPFNYSPCFVADLTVTALAPDSRQSDPLLIPQQDTEVAAFGPVAFEQNGRLVISTKNANQFALQTLTLGNPKAITFPGRQSLQLVGPAIHGGRSFPVR